jgi:hypothetical protein
MSDLMRNSSTCLLVLMLTPALCADDVKPQSLEGSPTPLSVAPLDHVVYPKDRPGWVQESTNFDTDAHTIVVVSGPSDSPEKSLEELSLMQRAAVSTYISGITDSAGQFDFYPITDKQIDRDLVVRRHSGEVTQGGMTKYEDAVELVFTEGKRAEIKESWTNVAVRERLGALGVTVFGGLVMLLCSSALTGVVSRRVERRDAALGS